jgi:steroid 5-alpha reductase family enzyme
VSVTGILLLNGAAVLGAMVLLWLASLARRDASIVDVWWGPGFALLAWVDVAVAGPSPRSLLAASLVTLWAARLGGYLLWRNHGRPEDPRYAAMRRRHGARFPWVSLATVFALQGVLQVAVGLPVWLTAARPGPTHLGVVDLAGTLLFATGLAFEAIGDLQLARFRADPANAHRVMDRGLWALTRHPNYFGDCVAWWGIFVVALGGPLGWASLPGPALMTFLLLRVSGVALLERTIARRRPDYAAYADRVPAFFPRPPRAR